MLDPELRNLDRGFEVLVDLQASFRIHLPAERLEPRRAGLDSPGAMLLMSEFGPLDLLGTVVTGWRLAELVERERVQRE